jgi:hypothetical protein
MLESELKQYMDGLYKSCSNKSMNLKNVIANAVQLGMRYQEEKIKSGIDIVFNELHKK